MVPYPCCSHLGHATLLVLQTIGWYGKMDHVCFDHCNSSCSYIAAIKHPEYSSDFVEKTPWQMAASLHRFPLRMDACSY